MRKGRGSGILFRVTGPSIGFDAQRGYFIGIKPSQDAVLLGKMDGSSWQELERVEQKIDVSKKHRLQVSATGKRFTFSLNGKELFTHSDATYKRGAIGLRTTDIPTTFSDLELTAN